MQVSKEPYDDSGERDEDGYFGQMVSGVVYRFVFRARVLVARRYDHRKEDALFFGVERFGSSEVVEFAEAPYGDAEFGEAVAYLRESEGVRCVEVRLARGWVEVDLARLAV